MPSPIFPIEEDPIANRIDKRDPDRLPVGGALDLRGLFMRGKNRFTAREKKNSRWTDGSSGVRRSFNIPLLVHNLPQRGDGLCCMLKFTLDETAHLFLDTGANHFRCVLHPSVCKFLDV